MKIEFSKEEIVAMLLAKASEMTHGSIEFNEVSFDARYSTITAATVFYTAPVIEEIQNGAEVA
jgi:hypothetical protein